MRIQITRSGTAVDLDAAALDALRAEFDRAHCVVLREFIEPELLATLSDRLETAHFYDKNNLNVGDEQRIHPHPVSTALEFLTNDRAVYDVARRISGCPEIGCFQGRIYRLLPAAGYESDWHADLRHGRMLTLSVNLSRSAYEGGVLQIRETTTRRMCAEVANTGRGDAVLFRIDPSLEHRVTPLTGSVVRTAYAGWFLREPRFETLLHRRLNAASS